MDITELTEQDFLDALNETASEEVSQAVIACIEHAIQTAGDLGTIEFINENPQFTELVEIAAASNNPKENLEVIFANFDVTSKALTIAGLTFLNEGNLDVWEGLISTALDQDDLGELVQTTLELAYAADQLDSAHLLMERYKNLSAPLNDAFVLIAASSRDNQALDMLLDSSNNYQFTTKPDQYAFTLFDSFYALPTIDSPAACIETFFKHGTPTDIKPPLHSSLLHFVAEKLSTEEALPILDVMDHYGFDFTTTDRLDSTLLHQAALENNDPLCEILAHSEKLDVNAQDIYGNTAYNYTASLHGTETADQLFTGNHVDRSTDAQKAASALESRKIESIKDQFTDFGRLDKTGISLALYEKIDKKKNDNDTPNIYVVDKREFNDFMQEVHTLAQLMQEPFALQCVCQFKGRHWGCVAVEIDENKHANVCIIDSLADKSYYEELKFIPSIKQYFPDSTIYFNADKLQHTELGCSVFAVDTVLHMHNQTGLFDYLETGKQEIKQNRAQHPQQQQFLYNVAGSPAPVYQVPLPPRLVRTMQSMREIDARGKTHPENDVVVNKREQTFSESLDEHLEPVGKVGDKVKYRNDRLAYKLGEMHTKVERLIQGKPLSEINDMANSVSLNALRSDIQLYKASIPQVEIHDREKQEKPVYGEHTQKAVSRQQDSKEKGGWCNIL